MTIAKRCRNCQCYIPRGEAVTTGKKVPKYSGWCKYHDRVTFASDFWCNAKLAGYVS